MSTKSLIFISDASDTFYGIYCHWDGYPAHVGWVLNNLINKADDIADLIELGNISSIRINIEKKDNEIIYRASVEEESLYNEDGYICNSKEEMIKHFKKSWCDYLYYFDDADETWYVMKGVFSENNKDEEFVRLDSYNETKLEAFPRD